MDVTPRRILPRICLPLTESFMRGIIFLLLLKPVIQIVVVASLNVEFDIRKRKYKNCVMQLAGNPLPLPEIYTSFS